MRRFLLHRRVDVTGISGVGVVAEGVQASDGRVAIFWLGDRPSTVVWVDLAHAYDIHGHGGHTEFVFLDE